MSDDGILEFRKPGMSFRVDREVLPRECAHHHVTIRERPRRLKCRDCKKDIDPFEYLLHVAQNWESLFPKNEAARKLETALNSTLAAHGSVTISESGVTAKCLTEAGQTLEARQTWSAYACNGGVVAAVLAAVEKLSVSVARWGQRDVRYPRMTIEKVRGQKRWKVGVLSKDGWHLVTDEAASINEAYDAAKNEAERLGEPFIHENRPKKLWR